MEDGFAVKKITHPAAHRLNVKANEIQERLQGLERLIEKDDKRGVRLIAGELDYLMDDFKHLAYWFDTEDEG